MEILLSAYSCEPNKGSEPQVGWDFLIDYLNQNHKVYLITRKNNVSNIKNSLGQKSKLVIIPFDLPKFLIFLKRKIKPFLTVYIFLWEFFTIFKIFKLYGFKKFDMVHKSTMLSYKYLNFTSIFAKDSVIGPIAGAETYPISFLRNFTLKGKLIELIRFIFIKLTLYSPLNILMLSTYKKIHCANYATFESIPSFLKYKCEVKKAIKVYEKDFMQISKKDDKANKYLNILYVGRVIELKGLAMLLKALIGIDSNKYCLKIVGEGEDESRLKKISLENNLNVKFEGYVDRNLLSNFYKKCDLFFFPSLHDSSGYSVLEAKLFGKKVVCTNYGGPKHYVDSNDIILRSNNYYDLIKEIKNLIEKNINK